MAQETPYPRCMLKQKPLCHKHALWSRLADMPRSHLLYFNPNTGSVKIIKSSHKSRLRNFKSASCVQVAMLGSQRRYAIVCSFSCCRHWSIVVHKSLESTLPTPW